MGVQVKQRRFSKLIRRLIDEIRGTVQIPVRPAPAAEDQLAADWRLFERSRQRILLCAQSSQNAGKV